MCPTCAKYNAALAAWKPDDIRRRSEAPETTSASGVFRAITLDGGPLILWNYGIGEPLLHAPAIGSTEDLVYVGTQTGSV